MKTLVALSTADTWANSRSLSTTAMELTLLSGGREGILGELEAAKEEQRPQLPRSRSCMVNFTQHTFKRQ